MQTALLVSLAAVLAVILWRIFFSFSLLLPLSSLSPPFPPLSPLPSSPGRPLLFPCTALHSRSLPTKRALAYAYLVIGVPVDWEGAAGGLVSAGALPRSRRAWYHVDPGEHSSLRSKLDARLVSQVRIWSLFSESHLTLQDVDPARYPHAYLVTGARLLVCRASCVSLWYLYDAEWTLAALLVELDNPFGERRMYFLQPREATSTKLRDFYADAGKTVYATASDPLRDAAIDTAIVLHSPHGHKKIDSRFVSSRAAVNPSRLTAWQMFRFLASWAWADLVTVTRALKGAAVLFFHQQQHVADGPEVRLEQVFRRYLRHLVAQQSVAAGLRPVSVRYVASIPGVGEEWMHPTTQLQAVCAETTEFRVLTPAFYTRFVHYAQDMEALWSELRESRTIAVSRPELLARLVMRRGQRPAQHASSIMDYVRFRVIQHLRRRPERVERSMTWPRSDDPPEDHRGCRPSAMDAFVLAQQGADEADRVLCKTYCQTVLGLFLAERAALGSSSVFRAEGVLALLIVLTE